MDRVVLQRIVDRHQRQRAAVLRACPKFCSIASDNGVTHEAGMRVVDGVTGEIVEVVDAREFPVVSSAT